MNRYFQLLILLLISAVGLSGTKIHEISAPYETPIGDEFIVSITCSPPSKGTNRIVVIEHPLQCSLKTVYAVSPKHPDVLVPLRIDAEVHGLFQKEKGRTLLTVRDESNVYVGEANVIVYYFVFIVTDEIPKASFKCALVERTDPDFKPEPTKDKKGKKKVKAANTNWRMVNPPRGTDLRMTSFSVDHTAEVLLISGWAENSRALHLKGKWSSASLTLPNDSLGNVLWNAFSVSFWCRTIEPLQDIVSIIRGADTIRTFFDSYGQVTVRSHSEHEVTEMLQSPYLNNGAWHHYILSKDSNSVWRLFIDGELVDTKHFGYLSNNSKGTIVCGSSVDANDIYLDELAVQLRAVTHKDEIRQSMTVSMRDTLPDVFAVFHFEEYNRTPRSSVYEERTDSLSGKVELRPITMSLDSNAVLTPTSSPVLFEEAVLTVDRPSVSKLNFEWRSSRESNILMYQLERRIESYGEYVSVLRLPAKKYISPTDSEAAFIGRTIYSASETLPKISKDIDLYYRLGLVSQDSSIRYMMPIKIEYGDEKDIFLEQNKPNPFNSKTTISYTLKKTSWLNMAIYDIMGRQVAKLVDAKTAAGKHTIEIDASNWLPGIYFYKAKIGKQTITKRMIIIK